jgi:hypothetical protein
MTPVPTQFKSKYSTSQLCWVYGKHVQSSTSPYGTNVNLQNLLGGLFDSAFKN